MRTRSLDLASIVGAIGDNEEREKNASLRFSFRAVQRKCKFAPCQFRISAERRRSHPATSPLARVALRSRNFTAIKPVPRAMLSGYF